MAATVTVDAGSPFVVGDRKQVVGTINLATYATGGVAVTPAMFGLTTIDDLTVEEAGGLDYRYNSTTEKVMAYMGGGGSFTPAGSIVATVTPHADSAGTPAGAVTGALELTAAEFSGTGFATVTQEVTTTDNQTMTLNQCAGMWFINDAVPAAVPCIILSNTAVTGAPAVLTCQGVPPVTDAGTYKIVTMGAATFVGSALGTHSHESTVASAFTGTPDTSGAVAAEVGAISLAAAGYTANYTAIGK